MFKFLTAGINVSNITPERIQTQGDQKTLDLVLIPNKNGRDQYNKDGFIVEDTAQDEERGEILGNFRLFPDGSAVDGPVQLHLQLHRIDKSRLIQGQKGKYLDLVAFPNREGRNDRGEDGVAIQSVSKEEREAGQRGPIIGNFRLKQAGDSGQSKAPAEEEEPDLPEDEEVPF